MGNFYSFLKKKINNESFNINSPFIKNSLIDNSNVVNIKTNHKLFHPLANKSPYFVDFYLSRSLIFKLGC